MDDILQDDMCYSCVICADSASNDAREHEMLNARGIEVICLDHHECNTDYSNRLTTVINVQICDYPNKALTGAGVAWQFCRAWDEINGYNYANNFIDLAALGDCGDMASYKELEIRALMNLGLSNIKNPFFYAMAKKNDYSIQKMNGINYYSVAFYVVPFINAMVRSGTMEEKEFVFNSFISLKAFDEVETSKRGHKGEKVKLYDEAVLIAERVKRRQTKLQDESLAFFESKIEKENLLDDKIILLLCEPGDVEKNLAGLVANKLQAKYQRPCAILTRSKLVNDKEDFYRGSMRNYGLSERQNLKDDLEATGQIEFCAGHQGAAGLGIAESKIESFIESFNELYKEVDQKPVYWVDYIWNTRGEIDSAKILAIADMNIYGQEMPESYVALNRIPISADMITLMSADKNPTIKIQIGDISLIKFKSSQEEYESFQQEDLVLSAVCKCNKNEWNGKVSPQLLVEEYKLDTEWVF